MKTETRRRSLGAWALGVALTAGWAVSPSALAQSINETEPNDSIGAANLLNNVSAVDGNLETITGNTTGSSTTTPGITSADYFRVKVADAVPGIYRYRMELTTGAASSYTPHLRGLDVVTGPFLTTNESSTQLQLGSSTTTPQRFVQWYGFGNAEEVYYRLTGISGLTGYVSQLKRLTVTPTVIATSVPSGSVEITTIGQTSADTSFVVLDATYTQYGTFMNDDEGPSGATTQSRAIRNLVPGTYFIGISDGNLVKSTLNPSDDDQRVDDVFFFDNGVVANSATASGTDLDFQVIGGATTVTQTAAKSGSFAIEWFQLTVTDSGNLVAAAETVPFVVNKGSMATIKVRTSPSTGNTISTVTADLSAYSLGTLNLTNQGGGVWSGSFTMPATAASGDATIPVTVTDSGANVANENAALFVRPVAPANDLCSGAVDLNAQTFPFTTTVDTAAATGDAINVGSCSPSTTTAAFGVWYKYATGASPVGLKVSDSQNLHDVAFALFEATNPGSPCSSLSASLSCQDPTGEPQVGYFNLAANKTYYIIVINDVSTTTVDQDPITLTFDFVTIPTNDTCAGALDIVSVPFNSGKVPLPLLTADANDPSCSATSFAQGAWYKYTPASNESIGFRSNVSTPDIDVVVYSAPAVNPCSGLTFVECAITASSTVTYRVDLTGGTTYYFLIGDQTATVAEGEYDFQITTITPPANDTCAGAEVVALTGAPGTAVVSGGLGATDDLDMSCNDAALTSSRRGVWYTFTTTDAGELVTTDQSSLDVARQFYTGSCGSLTPAFCDYDDASTVVLNANTTYYLLVSTFTTPATSDYELTFVFNPRTGACCTTGSCTENVTRTACESGGGTYQGDGVLCAGGAHAQESMLAFGLLDATGTPLLNESWRDLTVAQPGTVSSVQVAVDMLHTAAGEVGIFLRSPTGTEVALYDRTGTANVTNCPDPFVGASSEANLDGVFNFSDTFTGTLRESVFPLTLTSDSVTGGDFRASDCTNALVSLNSAFAGQSLAGTWRLRITDNKNTDTGTLRGWSLTFNGGLAAIFCNTAPTPCEIADFDNMNGVDVVDLFAFLDAWFAETGVCMSNCSSDISLPTGSPDVTDLFDYLDLWFFWQGTNPCP